MQDLSFLLEKASHLLVCAHHHLIHRLVGRCLALTEKLLTVQLKVTGGVGESKVWSFYWWARSRSHSSLSLSCRAQRSITVRQSVWYVRETARVLSNDTWGLLHDLDMKNPGVRRLISLLFADLYRSTAPPVVSTRRWPTCIVVSGRSPTLKLNIAAWAWQSDFGSSLNLRLFQGLQTRDALLLPSRLLLVVPVH